MQVEHYDIDWQKREKPYGIQFLWKSCTVLKVLIAKCDLKHNCYFEICAYLCLILR